MLAYRYVCRSKEEWISCSITHIINMDIMNMVDVTLFFHLKVRIIEQPPPSTVSGAIKHSYCAVPKQHSARTLITVALVSNRHIIVVLWSIYYEVK